MKNFLDKAFCDRCGKKLSIRIMSKMNTDVLCLDCIEKEKEHPLYKQANKAELEQVQQGNYNYPGLFAKQKWPNFSLT